MNISPTKLLLGLSLVLCSVYVSAFDLGFGGGDEPADGSSIFDIGDIISGVKDISRTVTGIDEEDEIEIGRDAASVLLGASKPVNDPELQRYVNRIGRWVVNQTDRSHLPWRFAVLNSTAVNAFATPGGNIFITDGLLRLLNNEAELAAVLAHEVAHVVQKHHINAMSSINTSGFSGLVKLASMTREGRSNKMASQMVGEVKDMYLRGLDKDDEFEADSMGTIIASRAGYDPFALMAVLQTLDSVDPDNSELDLLYKTHPPMSDRLDKLEPVLDQFEEPVSESPVLENRFNRYVRKRS